MSFRLLASISLSIPISYTSYVCFSDYQLQKKLNNNSNLFLVGAIDDQIQDNLETGDIILFRRQWYKYHLPTALMIKVLQHFNGEYDHSGIIIQNDKGEVNILENTPFSGCKLRRFDKRILCSKVLFL